MKILSIFIALSLFELSCSKNYQPKCSGRDVQGLLKEVCAKADNRDTSQISISSIRTVNTNEKFNSCDCAAHVNADAKVFSYLYFNKIDEDINYTAQMTDDGKELTVKLNEN